MSLKRRTAIVAFLRILTCGSTAVASSPPAHAEDVQASPLSGPPNFKAANHTDMIILTVDKTSLQAELKTWPEAETQSALLKRFRIGIGRMKGDKEHEGDNKTPEGVYFAQSHIDGDRLPLKYGKRAIPLDFPNPIDLSEGKTGHGIWLHGVEYDKRVEEANVTEGCVVFYNADINSLSNWLKSYQGVVVIASDISLVNRPADLMAVRKRTHDWMQSWAERRAKDYLGFYRADFRYGRQSLRSYAAFKDRVFRSYNKMEVTFDNLRVVTHPKYAVTFFNQDFHGDQRYTSIGRKALYWEKDASGAWSIKREVFESRRFEFLTFTDAELAMLSNAGAVHATEAVHTSPSL